MIIRPQRERKFPGPAGVVPAPKNKNNDQNFSPSQFSPDLEMSTQMERKQTLLDNGPWDGLLERLKQEEANSNIDSPMQKMNINWIQTKACKLPTFIKIPFLAAVLENAPGLPNGRLGRRKTPCVKLIDPSGTIEGALDAEFVHEHESSLVPGTALALQNKVGILRWKSKRELILTITSKNVIFMAYTISSKAEQKNSSPSSTTALSNGVKIVELSAYSPELIMKMFHKQCDPNSIREHYIRMENESQQQIEFQHRNSSEFQPQLSSVFTTVDKQRSQEQPFMCRTTGANNVQNNQYDSMSSFHDEDDDLLLSFDMENATASHMATQKNSVPTSQDTAYENDEIITTNLNNDSKLDSTFLDDDDEDDEFLSTLDMDIGIYTKTEIKNFPNEENEEEKKILSCFDMD